MIKKGKIIIFAVLALNLILSNEAYKTNSTNYNFDFAVSSGEQTNISSSSYQNKIILGIISESLNSTNYVNRIGFLYTSFYLNGESCFYDYECLGGYCCSNTCQSSSCPTEEAAAGEGAAGGGGGGAGRIVEEAEEEIEMIDFEISPDSLKITTILGKPSAKKITIKNTGGKGINVELEVIGLKNIITLSNYSLYIAPGELYDIFIGISSDVVGIFSGSIRVNAEGIIRTIPVIIEIETERALFDVKMDIPMQYKRIKQGIDLRAQITLFNVMESSADVSINYLIKDLKGNALVEESETFMVDRQKSYTKKFYTRKLKPGSYVAVVEVRYANSYAVSSQMFEVTGEKALISETVKGLSMIILGCFIIASLALILVSKFKIKIKKDSKRKK